MFVVYQYKIVKFEISSDTIKRTTKCQSNFSCLNGEENPKCNNGLAMCSVEDHIAHEMVFVDFNNYYSCNYSIPFGEIHRICNCPVRYEIYKRYQM